MRRCAIAWIALLTATPAAAQPPPAANVGAGVMELRHVIGSWHVRTEFLNPDGSLARAVDGSYSFEWAIPDAVVRGLARQPALDSSSALLFYVRPARRQIEMVSVDQAGITWVMTGTEGTDQRSTEDRTMSDGSRMRLRFTRFNVTPGRFESRMDYSTDGGSSWTQGNHQTFVRRSD
jgi:hypothetical protein